MKLRRELVEASIQRALERSPQEVRARSREVTFERQQELIPKRQRDYLLSELQATTGSPLRAEKALERIIKGNDLVSINYLALGLRAARSVCRIQLRTGAGQVVGYASGFLVGPGVVMTNHHVFESDSDAATALLDFDYEIDANGRERPTITFALDPGRLFHAHETLDFAVSAVRPRSVDGKHALLRQGWLPLSGMGKKGIEGEYLTIIQHPAGERKQICVRENKLLRYMEQTLWYETDTLGGSSGSPVFNQFWQVIALHHSGVPATDAAGNWLTTSGQIYTSDMDESAVQWLANEGIRISKIVEYLRDQLSGHPAIQAVLQPPAPHGEEAEGGHDVRDHGGRRSGWMPREGPGSVCAGGLYAEVGEQGVSLVIPIRLPIPSSLASGVDGSLAQGGEAPLRAAGSPVASAGMEAPVAATTQTAGAGTASMPIAGGFLAGPDLVEKVEIDTSAESYRKRPGYQADFLGEGAFEVPLPVIPQAARRHLVTKEERTDRPQRNPEILHYWNYSVVMNKTRRLAFYSAVNIDGSSRRDVGKREGDRWIDDRRIPPDFQVDDRFYKKQKTFEGRELNPFDQGHLVRRLDATWGSDAAEAKRNGDDTFHYTNCAPQLWKFNQGAELWLGLEEYVLDRLEAEKARGCVFNGPVFDGPEMDERLVVDPDGERKPDPKFGGVAIPKLFWKLLAVRSGGKLHVSAFVLSQERLMRQVLGKRLKEKLTQAEAQAFQVSVRDLAKLTGLGFGKLAQADTKESGARSVRRIEDLNQIRLD
jgi:endonuclease G